MYDTNMDIIKEVINIGMGEAANSLSKLVNSPVIIKVPEIYFMDMPEIREFIRKELRELGVYMSQGFAGMGRGKTFLFYTKECSISLLTAICGETMSTSSLTENEINTLNEIGNIIMGSCMVEMGNVLENKIIFDLPQVTVDEPDNYFQRLVDELGETDKAIVIKNEMNVKEAGIQGYLFVLLGFDDFKIITEKLQEKMKGLTTDY